MSGPSNDAPIEIVCLNCRRIESRTGIRFCPHCGAVLPVFSQPSPHGAGFSALAQAELPAEITEEARPILKPVVKPPVSEAPHQPWASDQDNTPIPRLAGSARPAGSFTPGTLLLGCLAVAGTATAIVGILFVLLILGVFLICSGVHC